MKHKFKIRKADACILIGLMDSFHREMKPEHTLTQIFGPLLSDIYKKLFRITVSFTLDDHREHSVLFTPLEMVFLYVVQNTWPYDAKPLHRLGGIDQVTEYKVFMLFDQQVPAHLVKHIEIVRALLNPITGERASSGVLIKEGGVQ